MISISLIVTGESLAQSDDDTTPGDTVPSATAETTSATSAADGTPMGVLDTQPSDGPFVEHDGKFLVPYSQTIPGTDVSFEMIPVPGGEFEMGSRSDDAAASELPLRKVRIAPFWIGKTEVTWGEYQQYMAMDAAFKKLHQSDMRKVTDPQSVDAVTAPSALYEPEITYEAGESPDQPAASMTQYAAKQYTKWLSLLSGQLYRLPYESEWEYACRAGTTTKYYFGDDDAELENHGWFYDNSDELRQACAQLPPNPWGLYDMYGNASEWVLDAWTENGYADVPDNATVQEAYQKPDKVFPRVLRGGSFWSDAELCNSAARLASDDKPWKEEDPNYPKSPWWYTSEEGLGAGMRIVRPYVVPQTDAEKSAFWDADVESISRDALNRIDSNGRGALGTVDEQLDEDIATHGG